MINMTSVSEIIGYDILKLVIIGVVILGLAVLVLLCLAAIKKFR